MRILSFIFGLIFVIYFCTFMVFLYKMGVGVFGVFATFLAGSYGIFLWFSEMVFTEDYSN